MESPNTSTMFLPQKININYKDEVCEVFELAKKHGMKARLSMVQKEGPIHNAIFTYRLTVGDFSAEAKGPTITEAKHLCAQQVLPELQRLPLSPDEKKKKKRTGVCWKELPTFKDNDNPVSCLDIIVVNMKGIPPKYTIVDVDKQSNPWIFFVQVAVADVTAVGLGLDKKDAKRNAASKVLNTFGYDFLVKEPEPRSKEDITSQQIETDVLKEVPKVNEPQQDQEFSVGDSIQTEEIQSPTEDTSVDKSAAAQDEATEIFLDDNEEAVQPPDEFVFVESPEDTATDVVDQAALLRDQEQSPVLTQTVSEEVIVCDVPREASTTQETETDVHEEVDESQQDQEYSVAEDDFYQTEEIQSPTDDTSVLSSSAAQDKAAEGLSDNIEEVQTPPKEFEYQETCEDTSTDYVEQVALLDTIEEVQTPPEEFVYVESPEDTATDGDQAELLRDQEQSPVLTQTLCEEVTVCDVPHDSTPEMDGWKIPSPTDDTSVLSSTAAQDEAAEVFLDNIEEEVQTPPEEFVYLETSEDTSTDGVEQVALLSDQEQSPEITQIKNEEVTVHEVLDQSEDDNIPSFEETVGTSEDLTTLTTQETVVNDTVSATSQPDIITEDISESSESSSSPDTFTEPRRISPTVLKASIFISDALAQKLFKLAGSKDHRNASLMGVRLHHSIKQQLELDENCQIKLKNLEKVGKAAAKRLSADYGSADAVLRAAREDDTAAFEAAAAKHMNAELRSFQKRPKSALSRLFSRMRRAFTF